MLTEQQKNYLSMLLVGDALSQSEIRTFLSRSGWNSEQVDLGIELSEKIKAESSVVPDRSAIEAEAITSLYSNKPDQSAVKNVTEYAIPVTSPEPQVVSAKPEYSSELGYVQNQSMPSTGIKSFSTDMRTPGIQVMPENTNMGQAGGVLKLIAWLLFIVLIIMVVGLFGYMYYLKIGIFENITYIKVF